MPTKTGHVSNIIHAADLTRLANPVLLFILVFSLVALGIAWQFEWLTIPFPRILRDTLLYACFFIGGGLLRRRLGPGIGKWIFLALHATPPLFLAWLWMLSGTLQNPGFLSLFVLALLASSLAQRASVTWLNALLSVLAVWIVAIHQTPLLQWYLAHLGWPSMLLQGINALPLPAPQGVYALSPSSPAFYGTVLLVFSCAQIALGFGTAALTGFIHHLHQRLGAFSAQTIEAKGLFQALLKAATEPTVVVYADSFQIVHASDSFIRRILTRPGDLPGKTLFDLMRFEDEAAARAAFADRIGGIAFCHMRIGPENLVANVNFFHTTHQGNDYLNIHFQEITDLYYFRTAFDSVDDALLIVDDDLKLLYANRVANGLFGGLYLGRVMAQKLAPHGILPQQLAETTSASTRRVRIGKAPYVLSVSATHPTAGRRCFILWFRSQAREEELAAQALRDPMTGLFNRRGFESRLGELIATSGAHAPLILALWDLDKLKEVNDSHGHAAGDEYIKSFARIVSSTLRSGELFARLGGDEFAVAFAGLTLTRAQSLIARAHKALRTTPVVIGDKQRCVEASVGLTPYHAGESAEVFIDRADKALYDAKRQRRHGSVVVMR